MEGKGEAGRGTPQEGPARRVCVNPQVATLVVDREALAPELPLRCCCLCHQAPPYLGYTHSINGSRRFHRYQMSGTVTLDPPKIIQRGRA